MNNNTEPWIEACVPARKIYNLNFVGFLNLKLGSFLGQFKRLYFLNRSFDHSKGCVLVWTSIMVYWCQHTKALELVLKLAFHVWSYKSFKSRLKSISFRFTSFLTSAINNRPGPFKHSRGALSPFFLPALALNGFFKDFCGQANNKQRLMTSSFFFKRIFSRKTRFLLKSQIFAAGLRF